jgi:hypothetical protein
MRDSVLDDLVTATQHNINNISIKKSLQSYKHGERNLFDRAVAYQDTQC